ncbi:uncharacterized protein LOC106072225 [Biomphalaria glabrata]|uniref:Uncharacterized protein LOC106072225 n=1 Tax=Biomphalaria glabrata TaxID=6526 RepID=A0A9U8EHN3_BIOGL|nr:uncharacterized protein LOC106072225 [Biomphalaria glabrata]XP_013088020.2 uncharacterized protein LOC106072225 [Biomphalaria glabrata]KAI8776738.1 hypothetical protein BgiBS90_022486 [Biomphalaria glabrata]
MKGLTRRIGAHGLASIFVSVCLFELVVCSCRSPVTELFAYHNPTVYQMNDSVIPFLTSDKGEECTFLISASDKNEIVTLSFPIFSLKSDDCLEIFDGKAENSQSLDELCDKNPKPAYTSSQQVLRVVYKRGEESGKRKLSMMYSSQKYISNEKIIRIAGIIGAVLAAIGLTFVILRATRCCSCIRNKNTNGDHHERVSSVRETTRLTTIGSDEVEESTRTVVVNPTDPNPSVTPENDNQTPGNNQSAHPEGSDSDSLPDVNELPPSYESLYLNELGEAIDPPNYSPPKHRSSHPPRRVHTIN